MKYFLDTEFNERQGTLELISIALVSEDGREYYAVLDDWIPAWCNHWVRENVIPNLDAKPHEFKSRQTVKYEILDFIGDDDAPEFWGWYADYDWVAFCWLFGAMVDLPKGWPMYCRDLKQAIDGSPTEVEFKSDDQHNALGDARNLRDNYNAFTEMFDDVITQVAKGLCKKLAMPGRN